MPTLKPLPSLARVEANRANSQHSTGPRTPEGKARVRGNAAKHGLTGAGIALPSEDESRVAERFASLQAELAPTTVLGAHFVGRIALMTVRTERAALQETAALGHHIRHAAEAFDEARRAAARALVEQLEADPVGAHRDLLRSPEGVDALSEALLDLRANLNRPIPLWSDEHEAHLEACHGRRVGDRATTRGLTLSMALRSSQIRWLSPDDQAGIRTAADPKTWLVLALIGEIDGEVRRLAAYRLTLDHALIALDRATAADRALFDPGRDATLARRYEAAANRELLRALAEYRQAEAVGVAPESAPSPAPAVLVEPTPTPPPTLPPPTEPISEAELIDDKPRISGRLAASLALFSQMPPVGARSVPSVGVGEALPISAAGRKEGDRHRSFRAGASPRLPSPSSSSSL